MQRENYNKNFVIFLFRRSLCEIVAKEKVRFAIIRVASYFFVATKKGDDVSTFRWYRARNWQLKVLLVIF